jgi:hypothetical protein
LRWRDSPKVSTRDELSRSVLPILHQAIQADISKLFIGGDLQPVEVHASFFVPGDLRLDNKAHFGLRLSQQRARHQQQNNHSKSVLRKTAGGEFRRAWTYNQWSHSIQANSGGFI